ncbi:MAG: hypothetical protein GY679_02100 [Mycoplasma sp.]|nr:hypothetical protein [Mycoplasma sp.]
MRDNVVLFPTSSTLVNLVVNGFPGELGFQGGKIHRLFGDKSSGKSYLCSETIFQSKKKFGKKLVFNYDDCESGLTIDGDELYGFPLITSEATRSVTVQDLLKNVSRFIDNVKKDEFGIYIVDSLDGVIAIEAKERTDEFIEKDKEQEDGSFSLEKYKFLKQSFYPRVAEQLEEKPNCILIIVSQLTTNIGANKYEKQNKVTGGKASEFFAHSMTFLKTVEKEEIEDKDAGKTIPISSKVKIKTEKLKAPRPYRDCFYNVIFEHGIDEVGDNLKFLFNLHTPTGKTKGLKKLNMEFDGQEFKGLEELVHYIEDNNKEEELKKMVIDKWEKIERKASETKKRKKRV